MVVAERDSVFGEIKITKTGGRVRQPKPRKFVISKGGDWLDTTQAEAIVDLLEKAGGDLELFAASFDRRSSAKKELVLTKVLFILNRPGNEEHKQRWEDIIECHREAKIALMKKQALEAIESMPVPKPTSSSQYWISYAKFWSDISDKKDARKPAPKETKADREAVEKKEAVARLEAMAERIANQSKLNDEEFDAE